MKNETVKHHQYELFGEYLYILERNNRKFLNDKLAEYDLNMLQAICLLIIEKNNNITQNELAETLFLTKSGITKAINNLKNNNYVKKVRSSEDKRVFFLKLTKKGKIFYLKSNKSTNHGKIKLV